MIGEQIGNFRIVSQLGAGGMGEVFLAEQVQIGTKAAIKMLQPHISADTEHVNRFFNEAIAASKIQHAGIGKIFDVGHTESGRAYLVMEFLDGETLAARVKRLGRLPLGQISDIGRQIASVLEAVHKAGITHRDLKPDNVFVVPDSELASGERVKVLDFGIAKLTGHSGGLTATAAGSMGTPAYMSPEQWKNSKLVDWRADAYSLGCLVFELAAGRPPFIAETIGEACAKHLTEEPPRLASVVAAPPALDDLIARLLAKEPDDRPASMRDIGNAFAALGTGGPLATAATMPSIGARQPHQIPMMVPTSTTLGGAASSHHAPAAGKKRGLLIGLVAGGVVLAGAATVIALNATGGGGDKQPEPAVQPVAVVPDAHVDVKPEQPAEPPKPTALGADEIEAMALSNTGALAKCFTSADGSVKKTLATMAVAPDGGVQAVELSDGADAHAYGKCLSKSIHGWKFRPSTGGTYKFTMVRPETSMPTEPPKPSPTQPPKPIDPKTVQMRLATMKSMYRQYRSTHGNDLDNDFEDLMSSLKLMKTPEDRLVRIEAMIAKIQRGVGAKPGDTTPALLDAGLISSGVSAVRAQVAQCAKPGVKGKVKVRVRVAPSGTVQSADVLQTPDPSLGTCVAIALRGAHFAKTQGGGTFAYPFSF